MTSPVHNKLRIIVFNVGNGDHILVQLPDKRFGIIDCFKGYNSSKHHNPRFEELPALTYLKAYRKNNPDTSLAFLHISHPDADHIKGFGEFWKHLWALELLPEYLWVFAGVNTPRYINQFHDFIQKNKKRINQDARIDEKLSLKRNRINNYKKDWTSLISALKQIKSKGLNVKVSQVIDLGILADLDNDVVVYKKAPFPDQSDKFISQLSKKDISILLEKSGEDKKAVHVDKNQISAALLLVCEKAKVLFGGDVPDEVWNFSFDEFDSRNLAKREPNHKAHLIKVSHHGSKHSYSERIWREKLSETPKEHETHVVISAGQRFAHLNPPPHPHEDTLSWLDTASNEIDCDVVVSSTNMCLNPNCKNKTCLGSRGYQAEDMGDLFKEQSSKRKKTPKEIAGKDSGIEIQKAVPLKGEIPKLAAIVYDIDPQTTQMEVKLWTIPGEKSYTGKCVYPPNKQKPSI